MPASIKTHFKKYLDQDDDQYGASIGHPDLLKSIASEFSCQFKRKLDPWKNCLVGLDGEGLIYSSFTAFLNSGDEVIMFSPHIFCHYMDALLVGARPVCVNLVKEKDAWKIDFGALERAFTPRTRMLILNTPHNPVWSAQPSACFFSCQLHLRACTTNN